MKGLNLLLALMFVLFTVTAVSAASFTTEGSPLFNKASASLSNLDTSSDQLLTLDACSAISVVFDPSVAVTATVVAQMDAAGAVSQTILSSLDTIAISGTTVDLPAGAIGFQVSTADTTSPSTVNLTLFERRFINCRLKYAQ